MDKQPPIGNAAFCAPSASTLTNAPKDALQCINYIYILFIFLVHFFLYIVLDFFLYFSIEFKYSVIFLKI